MQNLQVIDNDTLEAWKNRSIVVLKDRGIKSMELRS